MCRRNNYFNDNIIVGRNIWSASKIMKKLKRRDFLKMIGITIMVPTTLVGEPRKGRNMSKKPEDYNLEDMLAMKLNTSISFFDFTLMRVPGGWIYDGKQDTFVPEPHYLAHNTNRPWWKI